jgi:hypothetical protein
MGAALNDVGQKQRFENGAVEHDAPNSSKERSESLV